jgi:hypothetical protein
MYFPTRLLGYAVSLKVNLHILMRSICSVMAKKGVRHYDDGSFSINYIQKIRFYTSLCQDSSLLLRQQKMQIFISLLEFFNLKTKKDTFIQIVWTIIRKVSGTRLISMWIYSHLGTSQTLRFNVKFTSTTHSVLTNQKYSTKDDRGSE